MALSLDEPTIGRHMNEGESFLVDIPEQDARLLLSRYSTNLSEGEGAVLRKLIELKRKAKPFWGY